VPSWVEVTALQEGPGNQPQRGRLKRASNKRVAFAPRAELVREGVDEPFEEKRNHEL